MGKWQEETQCTMYSRLKIGKRNDLMTQSYTVEEIMAAVFTATG